MCIVNCLARIQSRRGLANIVTSGIILSSVSIMGVMMLGWSNTSLSEQRQEIDNVFNTQMNKIREDLIFENVWFADTIPRHVNITLNNIGTLGLNVTEIHFNNPSTSTIFYYTDAGIAPSETFSTNAQYNWTDNESLDLTVFTDRGNQFTKQVVAP